MLNTINPQRIKQLVSGPFILHFLGICNVLAGVKILMANTDSARDSDLDAGFLQRHPEQQ